MNTLRASIINTISIVLFSVALMSAIFAPSHAAYCAEMTPDEEIDIREYADLAVKLFDEATALYDKYNEIISRSMEDITAEELEQRKTEVQNMYLLAREKCREAMSTAGLIAIDTGGDPREPVWFDDLFGKTSRHTATMIYEYAVKIKPFLDAEISVEKETSPVNGRDVIMEKCRAAEMEYRSAVKTLNEACPEAGAPGESPECTWKRNNAAFAEMRYAKTCGM